MLENGKFLNRLRNVHLEKSVATGLFHPSRSPTTAKTPLKVHFRLRFQNLGKPRTAGLCGRAAGACDCGPLSCAKIERPSPLEKPSCKVRFFVQKHSHEYRQKVTVTTLFQTAFHRVFQLLAQTAHVRFHSRKRVHTRLRQQDRTQRLTRRNTGRFGWGVVSLPSERFARFGNPARPGLKTANFAAFGSWPGALPKSAESLRNSDALMRVAVPRRRGPAGLRDPVAVSLTALTGFTVLSGHDNSMQRKMLAGFTRWSAPCVLPRAAAPLLCPQHPSAADKTGQWKTGSAGSCRADFRFACARPA